MLPKGKTKQKIVMCLLQLERNRQFMFPITTWWLSW